MGQIIRYGYSEDVCLQYVVLRFLTTTFNTGNPIRIDGFITLLDNFLNTGRYSLVSRH